MQNNKDNDNYSNLRPIQGERRYIEYDEEFQILGVFGEQSGFCYAQLPTKEECEIYLN